MIRRLVLPALLLAACGEGAAVDPDLPPNIIVFVADDLGHRDVGFHGGNIPTPRIDALAAEGLIVERAYTFPLCSPSRYAFLTGRSPMREGYLYAPVNKWDSAKIAAEHTTLAEMLQQAGYQTWLTGKWHLGHVSTDAYPQAHGFDHFYGALGGMVGHHDRLTQWKGNDWQRNGEPLREEGYDTDLIVAEVQRLLASAERDRPFFLFVPFTVPHTPIEPPQGVDHPGMPGFRQRSRARYAAMVHHMDASIGTILDAVDAAETGRRRVTLFFSDHGNALKVPGDNSPLKGGKASCNEGGIRVPFVVHGAGWQGRFEGPTIMMDWLPTLAGLAGAEVPSSAIDGIDLGPAIEGKAALPERTLLLGSIIHDKRMHAAIQFPWKLVQHGPDRELYDLAKDPNEQTNLAAQEPERVERMADLVREWRKLHPGRTQVGQATPQGWTDPDDMLDLAKP